MGSVFMQNNANSVYVKMLIWASLAICVTFTGCKQKAAIETSMPIGSEMPGFHIQMMDSITQFNTADIPPGKTSVLMYFSPDCEYCQKETKMLIQNIAALKQIQFYLISPNSLNELKAFNETYKLGSYPNIIVAKDHTWDFYSRFKPKNIPYNLIYDKNKKLLKIFNRNIELSTLLETQKKS